MKTKILSIATFVVISLINFSLVKAQNRTENSSYKAGMQPNATKSQLDNKKVTDHEIQPLELERRTINLHKVNEKGEFMGPEQKISATDNSLSTSQEEKPKELPNNAVLKKPE